MPFPLSGNNRSVLIVADSIQNIVERLNTELLLVGWTAVAGSLPGDRTLLSGLTPHGLQCRVRLYNPGGAAVTARIQFKSADGTLSSTDLFLQPNLRYPSPDIRLIANPYQFFAFYRGGQSLITKSFICGGVPALYDFDVGFITQAVWCHGDATSDADATFRRSFKTEPDSEANVAAWQLCNGNHWQSAANGQGHQRLGAFVPSNNPQLSGAGFTSNPTLYYSGEAYKTPVDICWGLTSPTDFANIRGRLWDIAIVLDWFPQDIVATFDGHDWYNIMQVSTTLDPNPIVTGNDTGASSLSSLWHIVP